MIKILEQNVNIDKGFPVMHYLDVRIMRTANTLRRELKRTVGRIFRENDILFNEEVFLQNTSIDWEQLVQEAFCYGANITPPSTREKLEVSVKIAALNV